MVKGAGGIKKKPPEGVPADAVDISDDGGLCKRVLVPGDPAEGFPPAGSEVQVHYVGTLLSDGSKFDSSRDRPGNFKFTLGNGQVIKGWDKGVATMHKGEKAELFCRADYAYGETGSPPKIPGGATLKFEVELLSWGEPQAGEEGDMRLHKQSVLLGGVEGGGDGGVGSTISTSLAALVYSARASVLRPLSSVWRVVLLLPQMTHLAYTKCRSIIFGR